MLEIPVDKDKMELGTRQSKLEVHEFLVNELKINVTMRSKNILCIKQRFHLILHQSLEKSFFWSQLLQFKLGKYMDIIQ